MSEPEPRAFMARHWTMALSCPSCKTIIRYDDDVPPWRESEARRARLDAARAFAAEHDGEAVPRMWFQAKPEITSAAEEHAGYLQMEDFGGFSPAIIRGVADVELRCVDCPCCGAEVRPEHGVTPPMVEDTEPWRTE